MIRILIVTHGPLAQVLKESFAMFFGSMSDDVETIGLYPTDSLKNLKKAICEKVEAIDISGGVLVLVDTFVGSPFDTTASAIDELKEAHKLQCYTGINIPFLVGALFSRNSMGLDQLITHLADIGRDTTVNPHKTLGI